MLKRMKAIESLFEAELRNEIENDTWVSLEEETRPQGALGLRLSHLQKKAETTTTTSTTAFEWMLIGSFSSLPLVGWALLQILN